jgi:hypothetical protein
MPTGANGGKNAFLMGIPIALSIGLLVSPVSADSPLGRFQGFVLPKGSNDLGGDRMMVLDTATGWTPKIEKFVVPKVLQDYADKRGKPACQA